MFQCYFSGRLSHLWCAWYFAIYYGQPCVSLAKSWHLVMSWILVQLLSNIDWTYLNMLNESVYDSSVELDSMKVNDMVCLPSWHFLQTVTIVSKFDSGKLDYLTIAFLPLFCSIITQKKMTLKQFQIQCTAGGTNFCCNFWQLCISSSKVLVNLKMLQSALQILSRWFPVFSDHKAELFPPKLVVLQKLSMSLITCTPYYRSQLSQTLHQREYW